MAKVLQNFLIGVGLDTEQYDKGAKNVEGSLGRMRTLVGFTGTAIAGAFGLAGTAAINAGKRVHDFNVTAEKLKTPTEYVHNYGRALAALGGNAEEALAAISAIEKAQSDLKLAGMLGPLENVALARGDINALSQTQDGAEFLRTLAGMVPQMDKDQRRMVQDALGLSDAVMISIKGGVEAFDAGIARAGELYGEFGRATDAAREYVRAMAELNTQFQGIGETLAQKMLPAFTGVLKSASEFISDNQQAIDAAGDIAAKSPTGTMVAGASAGAGALGSTMTALGMGSIGGRALMGASLPGMAIGAGLIAKDVRPDDIEGLTGWRPSDYIFDKTPLDAARDAYNAVAEKYGFGKSEEGSGAISYLEGSYGRLSDQASDFDSYLQDYARSGGASKPRPSYEEAAPYDPNAPFGLSMPPVYAGGEVDNAEAAKSSPSVITIRDQRQQADKPLTTPRINVQNHLEVQMEMDGRAVDTRVIDVIERRERDAAADLYSSVDR